MATRSALMGLVSGSAAAIAAHTTAHTTAAERGAVISRGLSCVCLRRLLLESTALWLGEWVSQHHRLLGVGISMAVAGVFITAPAQAATADHASSQSRSIAAARPASAGPAYKSFSSSAKTAGRTTVGSRSVLPETAMPAAAGASVIYVLGDTDHCAGSDTGAGTWADPYCMLQTAVNAAQSGDTIQTWEQSDDDLAFNEDVSINDKTDLTIVGEGIGVGDYGVDGYPALTISNSTGITVKNLVLEDLASDTVDVTSSSGVSFDGDSLLADGGPFNDLNIGAGATDVSVTRTAIGNNGVSPAVSASAGASGVVLASDVMWSRLAQDVGITGAKSVDVTGDTLNRGCAGAVSITGAPAGATYSVEDDVFESGPSSVGSCQGNAYGFGPVVNVDSTAVADTTSDYNDFNFTTSGTSTEAYDWAGTAYDTLADFQAAVPQAVHDAVDPTADAEMYLSPGNIEAEPDSWGMTTDAVPVSSSLSIGTANTAAPGYSSTDFYGRGSYDDRGALEYVAPSLTAALTVYQAGGRSVQADAAASVESDAYALYTFNWGDGSATTAQSNAAVLNHTYANPGTYNVTVTVTDVFGDSSSATVSSQTLGSDLTPIGPTRVLDTRDGTGTGGTIAKVGPGKTLVFKVAGVGQIPAGATAVALNLTATNPTSNGFLTAYGDGTSLPTASNVNYGKGATVANDAIVPIGADGEIDITNSSTGSTDIVADASGYFAPVQAAAYGSLTPYRLLDTRTATGGHDAPLTTGDPVKLKVAGVGGVPADATAAALNLTVDAPTNPGYIRAYPDGGTVPTSSNLNFGPHQTLANAAIVPIGKDGYIDVVLPTAGSVRMVVDVDGYFTPNTTEADSSYEPVSPERWLDTRTINKGALQAGWYYYLPFGTNLWDEVDPTITGVVTNATVTQPTAVSGDLVAFPESFLSNGNLNVPPTSTLDFTKGATLPNLAITSPGQQGDVDFLNQSTGNIQLIVDLFGYFQNN